VAFTFASKIEVLLPERAVGDERESLSGSVLIARIVCPLCIAAGCEPWPWTRIW
jgi:hypothetical protein